MFRLDNALISALTTVIENMGKRESEYREPNTAGLAFLGLGLLMHTISVLIHDVIVKWVYCKFKKKRNGRRKCYYWNCKHWNTCVYNGGGRKQAS